MSVPEELRERLVLECGRAGYGKAWSEHLADDVLEIIAAAGFELVPTDRMDRLRTAAWSCKAIAVTDCGLQPGDLERGK
jgi:hypothetical protein